jgi:O-antigen/teichoic acid export membrane protein
LREFILKNKYFLNYTFAYKIKELFKLSFSTFLSQGILFGFSPLLFQYYGPIEFGDFAKISSIVIFLSIISTCQFEVGIIKEFKAGSFKLTQLSLFMLLVFVTIVTFIDILLVISGCLTVFDAIIISSGILSLGLYNIGFNFSVKFNDYSRIAVSRVSQVIITLILQIIIAAFSESSNGLIVGWLLGILISTFSFRLYGIFRIARIQSGLVNLHDLFKRRLSFGYLMMTGLANNLSVLIPIYLLGHYYSEEEVGLYAFAMKFLILPVTLVATNLSHIYYRSLSDKINNKLNSDDLHRNYFLIAFFTGLFFVMIMYSFPKGIFHQIFGAKWARSFPLMIQLIPFVFILHIASVFQPIYIVFERLKLYLLLNLLMLFFRIFSIVTGFLFFGDFNFSILFFVYTGAILWYIIFYNSIKITGNTTSSYSLILVFILMVFMLLFSTFNILNIYR